MNIVVCAKQVVDVGEIKIDSKTNKPVLTGIAQKISDIDKNAMEEAIKIKEKHNGKITVITYGPENAKEKLKELLAMGADEAVHIISQDNTDYYVVSTMLAAAIKKIGTYDIILCGEASIDLFSGQIGPRVAGILNIPQITYAQSVNAEKENLSSVRNLGDQAVTIQSSYPVLLTVTKEINQPRLPSLMQILGAANKPIHTWQSSDLLNESLHPKISMIDIKGVSMDRKNVIYTEDIDESVNKLVDNLVKEGVLR